MSVLVIRGIAVLIVSAVLAGALGTSPRALAADAAPAPEGGSVSTAEADALAVGDEIEQLRTRYAKTFVTGEPATHRSEVAARPIHFRQAGKWVDINPELVPTGDGVYSDAANESDLRLRVPGDVAELARLRLDSGISVGFGLHNARAVLGRHSGATMSYSDIMPGVDLRLTSLPDGLKEDLILLSADTPRVFTFPLALEGLTAAVTLAGDVSLRDEANVERALIPHGWMEDSSGGDGYPGTVSHGVVYSLHGSGAHTTLRVTLDAEWLADPARVYPVTVDPTLTVTKNPGGYDDGIGDTFVTSAEPNVGYYGRDYLRTGYELARHRAYIRFDLSEFGDGREIIDAKLRLWNSRSGTCENRLLEVRRVTSWGFGSVRDITWNNKPSSTMTGGAESYKSWGNPSPPEGGAACDNGELVYPLTTTVRNWLGAPLATANWDQWGVELRAGDEYGPWYFKQFSSAANTSGYPRMIIEHNRAPKVPTLKSPSTPPTWLTTRNPTFTAFYDDPDDPDGSGPKTGDDGWVEFDVIGDTNPATGAARGYDQDATTDNKDVTWSPSWKTATVDTLQRDGTFQWTARATDGRLTSGAASLRTVQVDTKPPLVSNVRSTSGHDVDTLSDNPQVTMSWGGSDPKAENGESGSGVKDYSYLLSTDGTAVADTTAETTGSSASQTRQRGTYWFNVRARDNAGLWGANVRYGPFSIDQRPAVTLVDPADDAMLGTRKPVLTAHYKDPDGDNGLIEFQIRDSNGTVVATSAVQQNGCRNEAISDPGYVASPCGADDRDAYVEWPDELEDGEYTWTARADDGTFRSADFSPARKFVIGVDNAAQIEKSVTRDGISMLDASVGQGEAVTFDLKVTNPGLSPITVASVTDDLPDGLSVAAGSVLVDSARCTETTTAETPSCSVTGQTVRVGKFKLPGLGSRTIRLHAVAAVRNGGRVCETAQNVAEARSHAGVVTRSAPAQVTICDTGLGLERWWSTLAHDVAPQERAYVNVGNGNLVVQATDSTPIQGHGRMGHVLRRTYNSANTTAATLPGSLGAGWQLNIGQADDLVGSGVGATGLQVPSVQTAVSPGAVTLVDRDGTRHAFVPRSVDVRLNVGTLEGSLREALALPTSQTPPGKALCIDATYQPPPGVELSLWRYIQVNAGENACAAPTSSDAVMGFVAMRPDRLRYVFDAMGRLLSMTDGAGNEMRYAYEPVSDAVNVPVLGQRLALVYEPQTCNAPDVEETRAALAQAKCRMTTLTYGTDLDPNAVVATDPAGRQTSYHLEPPGLLPQRLVKVTQPDGTTVRYTYDELGCNGTRQQLCSITDPRNQTTRFTFEQTPQLGSPRRIRTVLDRAGSALPAGDAQTPHRQTLVYSATPADGETTTASHNGREQRFEQIDRAARVAVVEVGPDADPLTRTRLSWDGHNAPCHATGSFDNNLCREVVEGARNGAATPEPTTPDAITDWTYNPEGGVLSVRRHLAGGDAVATFGYRTQFTSAAGTAVTDDDVQGGGVVQDGSRSAAGNAVFVLSDRTQSLTPRGNAVANTQHASYRTDFAVDNSAAAAPNASNPPDASGAATCAGAALTNTGLVCSQSAPAFNNDTTRRTTAFTYDRSGQRLTVLTPEAANEPLEADRKPTTYHYYADGEFDLTATTSAGGWLKAVEDPEENFAAFAYDAAGNVVRTWDRNATDGHGIAAFPGTIALPAAGHYSETRYAAGDAVTAFAAPWRYERYSSDPQGNVARVEELDANGNVKRIRAPRGVAAGSDDFDTTFDYDVNDRVIARVTPSGRRTASTDAATTFRYDVFGNKIVETDTLGHAQVWKYDDANRVTTRRWTRNPSGADAPAACSEISDGADGLQAGRHVCHEVFGYDGLGNQVTMKDAEGHVTRSTFDALGRETLRSVPRNATTSVQTGLLYDLDGNVTDVCAPREFGAAGAGCDSGEPHSARLYSTHADYGAAGAVTKVVRYRDGATADATLTETMAYDLDGNVVTSTNARGKTTTFTYDLLGRKQSMTTPGHAGNPTRWDHDAAGNVTAIRDRDPDAGGTNTSDSRITAYSYDYNNRVVDEVVGAESLVAADAGVATGTANRRTRREYDAHGNVVAIWGPRAFTTSTDVWQDPPSPDPAHVNPNRDFVVRIRYDNEDRPDTQWTPRHNADTAGPEADANPACATAVDRYDADTVVCATSATYDLAGQLKQLRLPTSSGSDDRYVSWTHTDEGLVEAVQAPSPTGTGRTNVEQYTYDALGRPLTVKRPLPADQWASDSYTWSFDGLLETETRQDSDAAPNEGGTTHTTTFAYDEAGNQTTLAETVGGDTRTTVREYTSDGLVKTLTEPGNRTTTYEYTQTGQPKAVYSPNANVWKADSDAATKGEPTTHTYADDDLLLATTAPVAVGGTRFRRTTYTYDHAGRKLTQRAQVIDNASPTPAVVDDGGEQKFSWLPTDDMGRETGRNGETIETTYDAAGNRKTLTQTQDGKTSTIHVDYYLDDLVRSVNDGELTSSYTYDGAGQIVVRKNGGDVSRYGYNDAGRATQATSTRTGDTRKWEWTYDEQGRHRSEQQPDGRTAAWTWNDDNTLRDYQVNDTDGTAASHWQYQYDELYRITQADIPAAKGAASETPDTKTRRYRYDAGGRVDCYTIDTALTECNAASPPDGVKLGKWDANNNRTAWAKQTFTYNADDTINIASDKNGENKQTLKYHAFGGMKDDGCGLTSYDGFDRLASVAPLAASTATGCRADAATASYSYDALDRQRQKTLTPPAPSTLEPATTKFTYDGLTSQTIREVDTGATAKPERTFTLGADGTPKAVTAGGGTLTEFLQTDGHGNISTTLKDGGGVGCTVRYDPFGIPESPGSDEDGVCNTGDTANDLFYRTARRDNTTGTYQFGSRTYDPSKAAFLTPDSFRTANAAADLSVGVDPLTRNRYSYVNGDPVNLVDPDGHTPCAYGETPGPCPGGFRRTGPERQPNPPSEPRRLANPRGPDGVGHVGDDSFNSTAGTPEAARVRELYKKYQAHPDLYRVVKALDLAGAADDFLALNGPWLPPTLENDIDTVCGGALSAALGETCANYVILLHVHDKESWDEARAAFDPGATALDAGVTLAGGKLIKAGASGGKRLLARFFRGAPNTALGAEIGILREAARGKGNFGVGSATRAEAETLGQSWVGEGFRVGSDGKTLISQDGLRQFRPPSYKPSLDKWQANLEQRWTGVTQWQSNAHLDILDP